MNFEEVVKLSENVILEKRGYKHREGYKGNEKGSYIKKGKTYWDYSGGATPGNERLVTQIQSKIVHKFDSYASREDIKKFLKTEDSQNIFDKLKSVADKRFGSDEDDPHWRAYVYGGLTTICAKTLSSRKGKDKGVKYLL